MSAVFEAVQGTPHGVSVADRSGNTRPRTAVIASRQLLADGKLIHIEHHGELYSLRETRLGKLILTK